MTKSSKEVQKYQNFFQSLKQKFKNSKEVQVIKTLLKTC